MITPGQPTLDPAALLAERFRPAIAAAYPEHFPDPAAIDPVIQPSKPNPKNPAIGDFQCNAAMALAKRLSTKDARVSPRDVAAAILAALDLTHPTLGPLAEPLTDASVAGPGFINITLAPTLVTQLLSSLDDERDPAALGIAPPADPTTVVVDLCGVNLAKEMHVGHLRSTVIGDAVARVFERLGHAVTRQNHVGDWGLPIAMVTEKLRTEAAAGRLDVASVTLPELGRLYREAQAECAAPNKGLAIAKKWRMGPKIEAELEGQIETAQEHLAAAKATLVRLQSGDAEIIRIWQTIYDTTMAACLESCRRLHTRITADASAGESSYRDDLAPLVDDLARRGVSKESDGAQVVRVEALKEPCLVKKSDGGFLYATTDLAAIRRRVQTLGASAVYYFVDARQALHFKLVFAAAHKAGYTVIGGEGEGRADLRHAPFGTLLGEDGRPFKTRSGDTVRLADLIDEAIERAAAAVREKNPDLPDAELAPIAEAVAVAAIKYADLSTERIKDTVFSFDRMLAFEGDTGPYLLYALVRIKSILRRAAEQGIDTDAVLAARPELALTEPQEKQLALALLRYPAAVAAVAEHLEPHRLTAYCYDLAGAYSSFFENCPVLRAPDDATRDSRLRLCSLTGRVLEDALATLGIPTVDRM